MPPSELAKRLKNLQTKSAELVVCLVALNRDSNALISALEGLVTYDFDEHDAEALHNAIKVYGDTLETTRKYLEAFCTTAGHVFDGGMTL